MSTISISIAGGSGIAPMATLLDAAAEREHVSPLGASLAADNKAPRAQLHFDWFFR